MSADPPCGDVLIVEAYDPVDGTMQGWYALFAPVTGEIVLVRDAHQPRRFVITQAAFWTLVAKLEAGGARPANP